MARRKVTVALDEATLRALDAERQRTGESRSAFIERALARQAAAAAIDRMWATSDMDEGEAMELATEELRAVRADRRNRAAS